jgi:hypothetical protein
MEIDNSNIESCVLLIHLEKQYYYFCQLLPGQDPVLIVSSEGLHLMTFVAEKMLYHLFDSIVTQQP